MWAERFKSVLLEGRPRVISMVAAYIDLNAVRAGLAGDPKDYRFCGYGEAVAGHEPARTGLAWLFDAASWKQSQGAYRQMLFGRGSGPQRKGAELTPQKLAEVIKAGGELPLAALLHCRVRYFSDGAVLGSRVFVREHLQRYRRLTGRRRTTEPRPLPKIADLDEITALRGLRESAARG